MPGAVGSVAAPGRHRPRLQVFGALVVTAWLLTIGIGTVHAVAF
jgi:hypothetical protein